MSRLGGGGNHGVAPRRLWVCGVGGVGPQEGHCLQIFLFTAPRMATGGRRVAGGLAETHYHTHTSRLSTTPSTRGQQRGSVWDFGLLL